MNIRISTNALKKHIHILTQTYRKFESMCENEQTKTKYLNFEKKT